MVLAVEILTNLSVSLDWALHCHLESDWTNQQEIGLDHRVKVSPTWVDIVLYHTVL